MIGNSSQSLIPSMELRSNFEIIFGHEMNINTYGWFSLVSLWLSEDNSQNSSQNQDLKKENDRESIKAELLPCL